MGSILRSFEGVKFGKNKPDHIRVLSGSSFYEFSCSQVQLDAARFSLLYSSVG